MTNPSPATANPITNNSATLDSDTAVVIHYASPAGGGASTDNTSTSQLSSDTSRPITSPTEGTYQPAISSVSSSLSSAHLSLKPSSVPSSPSLPSSLGKEVNRAYRRRRHDNYLHCCCLLYRRRRHNNYLHHCCCRVYRSHQEQHTQAYSHQSHSRHQAYRC